MVSRLNVCTSTLSRFTFSDVIDIVLASGYSGIELRVNDDYHKSLKQLETRGKILKRQLKKVELDIPILNTYTPITEEQTVERLLNICQNLEIPKVRLVLPCSGQSRVAKLAKNKEIIPSYQSEQSPETVLKSVQETLKNLELKAYKAGVKILLELHWGTVMSSFTSAYFLTQGLSPNSIGITFDPANMIVEGKEDWEFGIKLIRSHLDNVHVKNVQWQPIHQGWQWDWSPAIKGMVNWGELISLLSQNGYYEDYSIEDFLVPNNNKEQAISYLQWLHTEFSLLLDYFSVPEISKPQDLPSLTNLDIVPQLV
ncbi:MAG: sugar phosphate isomerase/epimerase family protein [Crocosphaera sp.]